MDFPDSVQDLLSFDTKAFAVLATLMPDGRPQATPVWFDFEKSEFRVNTARGRVKDLNMRKRSAVALTILDPDDPYRYMQVQGDVVAQAEENAKAHLDHLALKYHGVERFPGSTEGQTRVIYTIKANSFFTNK